MKQILVSYSGCTLIEQLFCDFDDELSQIDSSNIFRREPQKLLLVHKVEASVLETDKLLGDSNSSSCHSISEFKTKIFRKGTLTGKHDQGHLLLASSSVSGSLHLAHFTSYARQLPIRGGVLFRSKFRNAYSLPLVRCHKQLPGDTVNVVNNGRVEWYVPDNHDEPRGLFDIVIVRFY